MSRRNGLAIDTAEGNAPQGTRGGPRRSAGSFLFTPNANASGADTNNQLGGGPRERDRVNARPGHSPSASSSQGRAWPKHFSSNQQDEFAAYERAAYGKGFLMVSATPLTRSSYHAGDDFARLRDARLRAQRKG